jgi:hypothetical protein
MDKINICDRLNELAVKCTALADCFSGLPTDSALSKKTPWGLYLIMSDIAWELRRINDGVREQNET